MKSIFSIISTPCIIILLTLSTNVQTFAQQSKNSQVQMVGKADIKTVELAVQGMTCQKGCADGIDKKFKTVPGVVKSKTSLSTGKSVITYDESTIKVSDLIAVIDKKGYKAKVATPEID